MSAPAPELFDCLYRGPVTHRRYTPVRHALRYSVFSIFADVDQLDNLVHMSPLIGYNAPRFLSVRDRDHGPGDGTPIAQHVWSLVRKHDGIDVRRIFMFCFPRILGRLFNPLTVYIAVDAGNHPVLMIYEVSNTFSQRHSYVVPLSGPGVHCADKQFYVSPFNAVEGEYRFRLHRLGASFRLDIAHFVDDALVLSARIEGVRERLSSSHIIGAAFKLALQPLKVWGGIHWEALKLYLKGLRPRDRPAHAQFEITGVTRLSQSKSAPSKAKPVASHLHVRPQSPVRTP